MLSWIALEGLDEESIGGRLIDVLRLTAVFSIFRNSQQIVDPAADPLGAEVQAKLLYLHLFVDDGLDRVGVLGPVLAEELADLLVDVRSGPYEVFRDRTGIDRRFGRFRLRGFSIGNPGLRPRQPVLDSGFEVVRCQGTSSRLGVE